MVLKVVISKFYRYRILAYVTNFKTRVNVFHPYFIIQPKEPLKKIRFPLKRRKAAFIAQIVKLFN